MTQATGRMMRRILAPAIAAAFAVGGVALANPASATEPTPQASAVVVNENNFDLSETDQSSQLQRKRGGDHGNVCEGNKCGPITWCEDKHDGPKGPGKPDDRPTEALPVPPALSDAKAIIGDEPKGENPKGDGPKGGHDKPCFHKPDSKIDDDKCCKNPPGGTVYVKYISKNKVSVPGQITVKPVGGKAYTVNFWIKPGKSKVTIKELPNAGYYIKSHLFDCVFTAKFVKIKCETVKPTPTTTVTATPTPTATSTATPTPTATTTTPVAPTPTPTDTTDAPAPGSGGGNGDDELALTGSSSSLFWGGGSLLTVGAVLIIATVLMRRRNRGNTQFAAE
jgi:hypothetical protein